jgi:serine/threonine protein kinase
VGLAGQKLGNYELIAEIARGSTTDLLLARTRGIAGFERHVVIKRVRDERAGDAAFVEAFITEARLAATLHHHNVVQVQDINQENGIPYFAMEYVHGEDLRALLAHVHARKETIPIQHVLTIGCAVAAGLHHAHEQKTPDGKPLNLVHRDVTPANILVGYDGNVKIVDFGMAKAAVTSVTQVGIKKGKAPYMAPEQCAGQRVDRRSNVFALGIVLYELITARRLFKGASDHDTMMTIVHGSLPPPLVMRPRRAVRGLGRDHEGARSPARRPLPDRRRARPGARDLRVGHRRRVDLRARRLPEAAARRAPRALAPGRLGTHALPRRLRRRPSGHRVPRGRVRPDDAAPRRRRPRQAAGRAERHRPWRRRRR